MRAIIIDDEENNINNLLLILKEHCHSVRVVATARCAREAKDLIHLHQPDLLLLDIQMPEVNGFDLLRSLPTPSFEIIFITGFDKYAIQAIRFAAIDYLLKPIVVEDLKVAIHKAEQKIQAKMENRELQNLLALLHQQTKKSEHKIALPSTKETRFVNPNQIIYIESRNNYTIFYLTDSEKLTISKPLYEYEELLSDYGFIRCHNSYLINKMYVKSILKEDGGSLLMENGTIIPISRQKKNVIRNEIARK